MVTFGDQTTSSDQKQDKTNPRSHCSPFPPLLPVQHQCSAPALLAELSQRWALDGEDISMITQQHLISTSIFTTHCIKQETQITTHFQITFLLQLRFISISST